MSLGDDKQSLFKFMTTPTFFSKHTDVVILKKIWPASVEAGYSGRALEADWRPVSAQSGIEQLLYNRSKKLDLFINTESFFSVEKRSSFFEHLFVK